MLPIAVHRNFVVLSRYFIRWVVLFFTLMLVVVTEQAHSAEAKFEKQNSEAIKQKVEEFLRIQSQGAPGRVVVLVSQVDSKLKLEKCIALEASLPNGGKVWGNTTVAVRCTTPSPWTIYVQANVSVFADYVVATVQLPQGKTITANDISFANGDITNLPAGIFTDAGQVLGQVMGSSVGAGSLLRQDLLRSPLAVKQGQTVRLIIFGPGFSVTSSGYALNNASVGQMAQARASTGKTISGIAKSNGEIEVPY